MKRILFLLLVTFHQFAAAGWMSGNDLNQMLNEPPLNNPFATGRAAGYITAVADRDLHSMDWILNHIMTDPSTTQEQKGALVKDAFNRLGNLWICTPSGVTVGQLTSVVKNWLARYPQRWNESAVPLVQDALREAFPCNKLEDLMK